MKLPNSSRKSIKKFLHFKFFTFQNVKFKKIGYNNETKDEILPKCKKDFIFLNGIEKYTLQYTFVFVHQT